MSETDLFRQAFDAAAAGDLHALRSLFTSHPHLAIDDRILEESAGYNRPDVTQLILDSGATIQGSGEHYLVYAVAHGARDTADLLIRQGATTRLFWVAAGVGFLDVVQAFFGDDNRLRPAAWVGRHNWADFGMPQRPLPQDAEAVAVEGLICAAMNNRPIVVDALLARGVPINGEATIGTPLHWACYWDKPDMIEHLLKAGADKDARDDEWNATPFGWAEENQSNRAIQRLTALGITK